MDETRKALESLKVKIENKDKRTMLGFEEFLEIIRSHPGRTLRNIFQLFYDMANTYIGPGENEYPNDPESIGFIKYDCSKLFVDESDYPFFADRLFANRFVRHIESLKHGSQQNRIYIYTGPHGCGKSTFLNNLLRKFEEYTDTKEGQMFEIMWGLDIEGAKIDVPCPSHDHPFLIIPKQYRVDFLETLLLKEDDGIQHDLFNKKEYEWIFKKEVCAICKSLFRVLFDRFGSLDDILSMVKARPYKFDRRLGEGISVFNPGDKPTKELYFRDAQIQNKLDRMFGANLVKYVFSPHAKTNNGIYVLMDIKSFNKERLLELHNVISEGVHKVNGVTEEQIDSLFIALMNPEDKEHIEKEEFMESFHERIQYNTISYVMEVNTEIQIYRDIFGGQIDQRFLPKVLENFVRVVISSRMHTNSPALKEWIPDMKKYEKYCDEYGLLLRMEIYGGVIPAWLSEEDKKKFTAAIRRKLIAQGQDEGNNGISGRHSIRLFDEFFGRYGPKSHLITMKNVTDYFKHGIGREKRDEHIQKNFIMSLVNWYDYTVLNEIKESLYFYNKDKISEDILNYLCAVNYDPGTNITCLFTGKEIDVSLKFFKTIGGYITGKNMSDAEALAFAQDIQQKYVELMALDQGKKIIETDLYQHLLNAYARNLKEKVFRPFLKNESFRDGVKAFGTDEFRIFDTRMKEHISHMLDNLETKFGYTKQGAKEIALYVIDQKLVEKFSQ